MKYLNLFLESWKALNNKKTFAVAGLEFLFFLLIAVNALISITFVSEKMDDLRNFQDEFAVEEGADVGYIYGSLVYLSELLSKIFRTAILFFAVTFVLFGFFCGIIWKWSANLVNKKNLLHGYDLKYFLNFYLLSLVWFLIFAAGVYLLYRYGFSYGIFAAILFLFFYFVWINLSYFVSDNKVFNSFLRGTRLSITKFYIFIPCFLIFIILLAASSYLFGIFENNLVAFFGSFLGIFIFIWLRIFLILTCNEYTSTRKHS